MRFLSGVLACLIFTGLAIAQTQSTDPAADAPLVARGLTKVGALYLVEFDAKLTQNLQPMRQLKTQVLSTNRTRTTIERDVRNQEKIIERLSNERKKLEAQLATVNQETQVGLYNEGVRQINLRADGIRQARDRIHSRVTQYEGLDDPRAKYAEMFLTASDNIELAAIRYEELAKDPQVLATIEQLNKTAAPPFRLGPSDRFKFELAAIRKERKTIESDIIDVHVDSGVAFVNVALNGKHIELMIVDSGASVISLSADAAQKAGIVAGPDAPTARLELADGSIVEGKVVEIDSVRVGTVTVREVRGVIMPESVKAVCLLGGSFLQRFSYRMDMAAGKLHLTKLGDLENEDEARTPEPIAVVPTPAEPPATAPPQPPAQVTIATPPPQITPPPPPAVVAPPIPEAPQDGSVELIETIGGPALRRDSEGSLVVHDGERISTASAYAPPVRFRIVAKTNSTNLRLAYACDEMIFNWEVNPNQLRIGGGPAGGQHKSGAGRIPTDEWIVLVLTVLPDSMSIEVNGELRHSVRGDFSKVNDHLSFHTAALAKVTVKSVRVGKPTAGK